MHGGELRNHARLHSSERLPPQRLYVPPSLFPAADFVWPADSRGHCDVDIQISQRHSELSVEFNQHGWASPNPFDLADVLLPLFYSVT